MSRRPSECNRARGQSARLHDRSNDCRTYQARHLAHRNPEVLWLESYNRGGYSERNQAAALVHAAGRSRVSDPRPIRQDIERGRVPTDSTCCTTRLKFARGIICPGRTHYWSTSTRQRKTSRYTESSERKGQHPGRCRTRRRDDAACRLDCRFGTW